MLLLGFENIFIIEFILLYYSNMFMCWFFLVNCGFYEGRCFIELFLCFSCFGMEYCRKVFNKELKSNDIFLYVNNDIVLLSV